jgi:hypothetical protein
MQVNSALASRKNLLRLRVGIYNDLYMHSNTATFCRRAVDLLRYPPYFS